MRSLISMEFFILLKIIKIKIIKAIKITYLIKFSLADLIYLQHQIQQQYLHLKYA